MRTDRLTLRRLWRGVRLRWDIRWTEFVKARKKARYRARVGPPTRKTVVFVVGCQRSGTDMVIKTLDRSLDVERYDEYNPAAFYDCRIRDLTTRGRLLGLSSAKCIVFKPVCDCHRVVELLAEHPGGKVIWVYRRFEDVANSAVERWGDKTQRWLEDLLAGGGDWGTRQWNTEKVTQQCLAEVREACEGGLTPHGAAAIFWYMRNRTFFEQDLPQNADATLVKYEEIVHDPTEGFERLCRFLDIGFYPGMVGRIFASSVHKRPFPSINPRIESLCNDMQARLDRVPSAKQECS